MTSAARSSLIGAGCGATLMFIFDPSRGARRRALVRDKVARATRRTREVAGATTRDLGNRLTGLGARTRSLVGDEGGADDRVVCERIRAELGRVASHPRAIRVVSNRGVVTLGGDALTAEVPAIMARASRVSGVVDVRNEMRLHATANRIPSLQGGSERSGKWSAWLGERWSPAALIAASVGTAAIAVALARR
jgi:hypothetical protein